MNKIILIGFVGKDPETKTFSNGNTSVSFSLATSESWKKDTGEYESKTDWHNVVFYGKIGEVIQKHVKKGSQLCVVGKQRNTEYEKEGQKMYYSFVQGLEFEFVGKKSDNAQQNTTANNNNDDWQDDPF